MLSLKALQVQRDWATAVGCCHLQSHSLLVTCRNRSTPKLLKALPKNMGVTDPDKMSSAVGSSNICRCVTGAKAGACQQVKRNVTQIYN